MKTMVLLAVIAVLLLWSGAGVGLTAASFGDLGNTFRFIFEHWFPMDFSDWRAALKAMIDTLEIAVFSTLIALLIALPASFLAARNWAPYRWLYDSTRFLFNSIRSIPELVLALIFIPTLGLGPMPAVLALIIHNVGVFGKLISEMIEAADEGPQEAVKALGGTRFLVAVYGIFPQIVPLVLSQYFYRLEVAIRTTLILGIVGAGGIGQMLYNDFKQFMYQKVTFEVLLIMVLVMVVDYLGALIRKRVK
ncbi:MULTISPECIES: phosphonate ABC transporter, permease protein PhnE [unclassified Paenibacillus]|uniref:phosphonate ABC transporter, permease protein PhnE n=1 Tax=unclassified Paenibacillus TaxID=185978 RepID=UPI001AE98005|nr:MULTISPECIES: phosphonate ABC transporter, permease protein PhnE [unclassified Paenibacillus]MBP1157288.1 phosphonate transport system permease protein [Paenibacillus sp. PvP091]MBP1171973.1 phosphonate transport system permease protein [Paenibacillus sp. PvR098]MBP2438354.1 phosphonate transport system permease protein [Paenibacillus sp. PvP052]